jgi:hypothetical protein
MKNWNIKDYTYVAITAILMFIASGIFGAIAFLYSTPFFFVADFAYSFPHAVLIVICYLLIRKFPVWTYASTVEGILDCVVMGWSPIWLPLYVLEGLFADIFLRFSKGYENPTLKHCIVAVLIYEIICLLITWPTFIYVFKMHYPAYIIAGSCISGIVWAILGAFVGYKLYPRIAEAVKAY